MLLYVQNILTLKVGNMIKWLLISAFIFTVEASSVELMVGDLLLQPRQCWSCTLIEEQEESIYSHIGMVIEVTPTVKVVDSLLRVKMSGLKDFNSGTQKDQKISVRRFRNPEIVTFLQSRRHNLYKYFVSEFEGLSYDHDFIWNNFDQNGREKLYCSELISKLLSSFLNLELPIKRMKFDRNRDQWLKYFKGNPPDGKWGNSPASFENSDLFYEVGEI